MEYKKFKTYKKYSYKYSFIKIKKVNIFCSSNVRRKKEEKFYDII